MTQSSTHVSPPCIAHLQQHARNAVFKANKQYSCPRCSNCALPRSDNTQICCTQHHPPNTNIYQHTTHLLRSRSITRSTYNSRRYLPTSCTEVEKIAQASTEHTPGHSRDNPTQRNMRLTRTQKMTTLKPAPQEVPFTLSVRNIDPTGATAVMQELLRPETRKSIRLFATSVNFQQLHSMSMHRTQLRATRQ